MRTASWLTLLVSALAVSLVLGTQLLAASVDADLGPNEVKMGKEAAAEIAKEHKLSDNAEDLKRVREIGARIAEVANKNAVDAVYGSAKITPFDYTFNIIEDKDINAFSVPGGFIYVYRGLLDFVESDDELAAVIAHEITHASHHHMVFLLRKQASLNNAMAIALLATMLSGARTSDVSNVLLGAQLYQIAKLNGYGQQAERDSDYGAVMYMKAAGYNPVGLLTFMERLAKRPEFVDYGIYRSHPLDSERVRNAKKLIQSLGLPMNRRETTKAIKAEVRTSKIDDHDVPEVVIKDTLILRPAPQDGASSEERARQIADRINAALDANPKMHEIKVENSGVVVRGRAVLVVSDADARLTGKSQDEIAKTAAAAIRNVVWKELVDTIH